MQVFANASAQRATGEASIDFAGYVPRSGSWGISLNRSKYSLKANWNYRGRRRQDPLTGCGIEAGTFERDSKQLSADVYGEYRFQRHLAVFASLRNVNAEPLDVKRFGPSTPAVALPATGGLRLGLDLRPQRDVLAKPPRGRRRPVRYRRDQCD